MRMTFSIRDEVARQFQAVVPARQRSRLISRLLKEELSKHNDALAAACKSANRDLALEHEIEEWQSLEDEVEK